MSAYAARDLTPEQCAAVARRAEPLLLAAGAGSGKTSVLVERFVAAVLGDGVSPAAILAITFTDRAAGELRERVRARFLELGERERARDVESAFVSTFHGFCARVLRTHSLLAGVDPRFDVLDEALATGLRGRAFDAALAAFMAGERPAAVDLVAAYGADDVQTMIVGAFAALRSRGQRFPRLPPAPQAPVADDVARDALAACALLDELLDRFARAYEEAKTARGALDFDDLELLAGELFAGDKRVRTSWAERFALLMVDEFQDTNPRQLAIVSALDRDNLFTVGDELQAIYGFRHADVTLFRARRERLHARGGDLRLTGNFRSVAPVLDAVNAIFAERLGDAFTPLVARRPEPDGEPGAGQADAPASGGSGGAGAAGGARRRGVSPAQQSLFDIPAAGERSEPRVELLLTARDGWDQPEGADAALDAGLPATAAWRRAEARALARRVAELVESGEARAGETVVLLRATGDIEAYERELQRCGLRTLAYVGGFWGRLETRDLLAYLRALANPLDEAALYCALASPLAGVSSDGLALVARAARAGGRGAWAAASAIAAAAPAVDGDGDAEPEEFAQARERMSAGDAAALARLCAQLEGERRAAARRPISQLLARAMDAGGYREHLLAGDWGERRLANVHKLQRVARRYEASEGGDLRGFLDHVERLEAARVSDPDAPVDGVDDDTIRLMTIHSAKGLEFGVVCVADLGRAPNTRMPRLLVDGDRIGLSLVRLDGKKGVPALDYEALCEERRGAEAAEEDRIFYVAMTRARDRLLLSGATPLDCLGEPREGAPPIGWLAAAVAGTVQAPDALDPPAIDVILDPPPGAPADAGSAHVRVRFNLPGGAGDRAAPGPGPGDRGGNGSGPGRASVVPAAAGAPRAPGGPPRAPGGVPRFSRLSYTALAELERCGYRYYLERVLGLGEQQPAGRAVGAGDDGGGARERGGHARGGPTAELDARARGTLVHAVLEARGPLGGAAELAAELDRGAAALGLEPGAGELDELAAMLAAAACSPLAARIGDAAEVRHEHPFAFALSAHEPLVTGVIDVLAHEPGTALVVDYKTDRIGAGDLEQLVERDYGVQRLVYALAVLREASVPAVEVVHWYLERPLEPVAARFEAAERDALEADLAERVGGVRERGYRVSPAPHRALCATCPGRASLCSWEEELTLRESPPDAAQARAAVEERPQP